MTLGSDHYEKAVQAARANEVNPLTNMEAPQTRNARWLFLGIALTLTTCGAFAFVSTFGN